MAHAMALPANSPLTLAPSNRPLVSTFDVFDTLIARRCIEPLRIFEIVAELSGLANFFTARRIAEAQVPEPRTLDKIYVALAKILDLDEPAANRL
jgi:hypothetical protein